MTSRATRRAQAKAVARGTVAPQRETYAQVAAQRDALLDVLAAVLYAYGTGPDCRLPVAADYVGRDRRPVVADPMPGGKLVVRFDTAEEEESDG